MGDGLDELGLGEAVVFGQGEVEGQLFDVAAGNEGGPVTVTRLRSRGASSLRFQRSPKSTSSVRVTSLGAKSPSISWIADC